MLRRTFLKGFGLLLAGPKSGISQVSKEDKADLFMIYGEFSNPVMENWRKSTEFKPPHVDEAIFKEVFENVTKHPPSIAGFLTARNCLSILTGGDEFSGLDDPRKWEFLEGKVFKKIVNLYYPWLEKMPRILVAELDEDKIKII